MSGLAPLKRVGYCLGYLVLDKVTTGRDVADIAGWPESRYALLVRDTLAEIASP
ncbi:MAG: hypothetical protein HYW49_03145 [Deltaproteobacteria bacterium]|nr:hypothetical protein [Deltaproteobacteria bacterium]